MLVQMCRFKRIIWGRHTVDSWYSLHRRRQKGLSCKVVCVLVKHSIGGTELADYAIKIDYYGPNGLQIYVFIFMCLPDL